MTYHSAELFKLYWLLNSLILKSLFFNKKNSILWETSNKTGPYLSILTIMCLYKTKMNMIFGIRIKTESETMFLYAKRIFFLKNICRKNHWGNYLEKVGGVCRCRVGDPNSITTLSTRQKKIHILAQRHPFELIFSSRNGVVSTLHFYQFLMKIN